MAAKKPPAKRHKTAPKKKVSKTRKHLKKSFSVTAKTLMHTAWVILALMFAFPLGLYAYWRVLEGQPSSVSVPSHSISSQVASFPSIRAHADCRSGTLLNIVAHEDDDLLFMNPAIAHAISSHKCIRTVYVTAGDDGRPAEYWQGREQGAKAAYATMYGIQNDWHDTSGTIGQHRITLSYLGPDSSASLIFLRLPDGRPGGTGFPTDKTETLRELREGKIHSIHTIDNSASYTASQFVNTLESIIKLDSPSIINTQAYSPELANGDHSDHQAVGYFVNLARRAYGKGYTFTTYLGYQSNSKPANLSKTDAAEKQSAFQSYENYDTAICIAFGNCPNAAAYNGYIERQYVYFSQSVQPSPAQ